MPYPIAEEEAQALRAISTAVTTRTDPIPPEAGNVHLPDPGPRPPMTTADAIAFGVLLTISGYSVVGMLFWLAGKWSPLLFGATP